jgi:hypothetical protein
MLAVKRTKSLRQAAILKVRERKNLPTRAGQTKLTSCAELQEYFPIAMARRQSTEVNFSASVMQ